MNDQSPAPDFFCSPGEDGWDAGRQAFNLAVDLQPALIAHPASADEVAEAVRYAAANGLRVAAQRSGHNAGPLTPLSGTLLLKTERLGGVEIDAGARRARVGAGAIWDDLVPAASELGLAAMHGSSPDVGIAGYSLGGGLGWYSRAHGLAANKVTAIELVLADGRQVRVDADNDADLFWALRGGGGSFGVVTALELELLPIERVFAGTLFFPIERAGEVLEAWRAWTAAGQPDEIASVGRLMRFPPFEDVPEPVRGKAFALIEAVYIGDEAEGADLIAPLRELGPAMDSFSALPPAGIAELHMDPRDPVPAASTHAMLGDLSAAAIESLVETAGPDSACSLISVELRHAGAALSRGEDGCGVAATLPGSYAGFAVGIAADPDSATKTGADLADVDTAWAPHAAGKYLNFSEVACDVSDFFDAEALARLVAVRDAYDPERLFQANHEVG